VAQLVRYLAFFLIGDILWPASFEPTPLKLIKSRSFNVALQKTGDGNRTNTTDQNNSLCLLFSSIGVKWSQLYVAESGGSRRWTTQILSKGFFISRDCLSDCNRVKPRRMPFAIHHIPLEIRERVHFLKALSHSGPMPREKRACVE